MKKVIALAFVALFSASATAYSNVTCNTYGNTTTCSGTVNGKWVSQTCNTYGNSTSCTSY